MNPLAAVAAVFAGGFTYAWAGLQLHPGEKLHALLWPLTMMADAVVWGMWFGLRAVAVTVIGCGVALIIASFYGAFWQWIHGDAVPHTIDAEAETSSEAA